MIFNHYASKVLEDGTKVMTEEDFNRLLASGLVSKTGLRDIEIRVRYKKLREKKFGSGEAIDEIRKSYSYLQFDTIRKIIYGQNNRIVNA